MAILNFSRIDIRKDNKRYMIMGIVFCILLLFFLFFVFNSTFRNFITIYIFRKQVSQDNVTTIELAEGEDSYTYAYDKYITVLNKNTLYTYNASGNVAYKNELNITIPLFSSNNRFLAIAEKNGNDIYLLSGQNIIWQGTVDGKISQINVNNNGYISVILNGTSYKSIIVSFDSKGKELFKTYLSNTIAIDTDISNDNKYLSVAEVDYSGSLIKSMIKTISVEKAIADPTNSVVYTYSDDDSHLITDIHYQNKALLACMYNDSVALLDVKQQNFSKLMDFEKTDNFSDINLKSHFVTTANIASGFTSKTNITVHHLPADTSSVYTLDGSIKSLYCYGEKIAVNTGSEIHFINSNAWLVKKYSSSNEINTIVLGDNIAGVVYKDKVEVVQF